MHKRNPYLQILMRCYNLHFCGLYLNFSGTAVSAPAREGRRVSIASDDSVEWMIYDASQVSLRGTFVFCVRSLKLGW